MILTYSKKSEVKKVTKADDDYCLQDERELCEDEGDEPAVRADSDAVVDPGTVVVELVHTALADVAVARPRSADHLAFGTQTGRVERLE